MHDLANWLRPLEQRCKRRRKLFGHVSVGLGVELDRQRAADDLRVLASETLAHALAGRDALVQFIEVEIARVWPACQTGTKARWQALGDHTREVLVETLTEHRQYHLNHPPGLFGVEAGSVTNVFDHALLCVHGLLGWSISPSIIHQFRRGRSRNSCAHLCRRLR